MEKEDGSCGFLYFTVFSVNLASFAAGTVYAWSSPSLPRLNGRAFPESNPLEEPLTPSQETLIASLMALGGIFGAFIGGWMQDKLGRKKSTIIAVAPFCVSFAIIAIANRVWHFYIARFLCGASSGATFVILPNYVAEISQKHNRGTLSCVLLVNVTLGSLVMYCVGPYFSIAFTALICLIPPTLFLAIVAMYVPESPYHLVKRDVEAAAMVLVKLRGKQSDRELSEIKTSVRESFCKEVGAIDLFTNKLLTRRLIIAFGLVMFQQCSGVNAILFYLESLFEAAGSDLSPAISSIVVAATQVVAALMAPLAVDRLGRRFLLFVSAIGNAFSLIAIGAFFYVKEKGNAEAISWLPIASLIVFIFTYTFGYGPMPFIVLGEIFPPNFKAVASTLTVSLCFVFTFATTMVFPYLLVVIGAAASFWLFAGSCIASLFFIHFLLPETKGKSLADIQKMMNKH